MKMISATTRLTLGLVCLAFSVCLVAYGMGLFPDRNRAVVEGRTALSENVALHCSLLASRSDWRTMERSLEGLVSRQSDVLSAAIRRSDQSMLVSIGPHRRSWDLPPGDRSTATQMRVPIFSGDTEWGSVELRFAERSPASWLDLHPLFRAALFCSAASCLLFHIYLGKMLQQLNPTRVIPRRVRQTLDNLAEGLLVLDSESRILLANRAFAENVGTTADELTGRRASDLPFEVNDAQITIEGYPWDRAMQEGEAQIGEMLTLRGPSAPSRVMKVSATPIIDDDGKQRGALASFDDVTQMEQNRVELRQMLDSLSRSRDEIQRQNLELERIASRDSLTGCLNRRAFFTDVDNQWNASARYGYPLACIMVDLDHFKSINDNHGHHAGDLVLQEAAKLLKSRARRGDLVARYGGEEFCVLLPHTDLDEACKIAWEICRTLAAQTVNGLRVTASLGVTSLEQGASTPQALIDQADHCLYVAKREGRNRVVRFDEAKEAIAEFQRGSLKGGDGDRCEGLPAADTKIPFHAVTALLSALAYRDIATANHSRRVADLAVASARRLMPPGDSYVLEIAALLHDIGKIGIPDSILLKQGPLTEAEWQVMHRHERIGVEIIKSTFSSAQLTEIMRTYRAWYGGPPRSPDLPAGEGIPLAARILAIADAFDAMTNEQYYRSPLNHGQALGELRRGAGRQFDPELVERFIDLLACSDRPEERVAESSQVAAISLGTQIEGLAEALDNRDLGGIATLAQRLQLTAGKFDATEIAEIAAQLESAARSGTDVKDLVQLTTDLVDLCRSVQRAFLQEALGPAHVIQLDQNEESSGNSRDEEPANA